MTPGSIEELQLIPRRLLVIHYVVTHGLDRRHRFILATRGVHSSPLQQKFLFSSHLYFLTTLWQLFMSLPPFGFHYQHGTSGVSGATWGHLGTSHTVRLGVHILRFYILRRHDPYLPGIVAALFYPKPHFSVLTLVLIGCDLCRPNILRIFDSFNTSVIVRSSPTALRSSLCAVCRLVLAQPTIQDL